MSATSATSTGGTLLRFDLTQRITHWANAALFFVLLATGAVLYGAPGTTWVGHRAMVKDVHVWSGIALPLPILLAIATSPQMRTDLRRFSRWVPDDWRWWRRRTRATARLGKFNPGQKLNATFVGASIVVMLATGAIMRWPDSFSDSTRTSATVVHDWNAWALGIVVVGHIVFALRDPVALRSMWHGSVPRSWAQRHAPRWKPGPSPSPHTDPGDPVSVGRR